MILTIFVSCHLIFYLIFFQGHKEGEVWGLSCHPIDLQCATVSDDGYLRLWNLTEPRQLYKFKELKKPARSVDYSPDGKLIAVGFKDGQSPN